MLNSAGSFSDGGMTPMIVLTRLFMRTGFPRTLGSRGKVRAPERVADECYKRHHDFDSSAVGKPPELGLHPEDREEIGGHVEGPDLYRRLSDLGVAHGLARAIGRQPCP